MTGPSVVFSSAFTRHADAQAGWLQWRHCFRAKTGLSGSFSFANRLTTVYASGVGSLFCSNTLSLEKETSGFGRLFFSLHASSHARHPMHFVVSINIP